jgi:ATP-binding cassette subfamily C protein CydC
LLRILVLWRSRFAGLFAGVLIALAAVAAGLGLMALSGAVVAGAVVSAALWLRVAGPARIGLRYAERLVSHGATFRAIADLRVWFFRGFAARSAGGLGFRPAGDLLNRLIGDIEALDGLYLRIILPFAAALLAVPAAALLAGRASVWSGLAVLALFGAAAVAVPLWVARDAGRAGVALAEASGGLRVAALDALTGLREVRAFGAEQRMQAAISAREKTLIDRQRETARRVAGANAVALLCGQFAVLAVLAAAHAPPVLLVACVFLVVAAFEAISILPRAGVVAGNAATSAARILDVAEGETPMPEPARPAPVPAQYGLRFERLHFRWTPDGAPVFDGLTLELPQGTHAALLGPSGAGKSTLAALALKVVAPEAGRITLGGTDLAAMASTDVRRRIAWLSQTTHIFDDSIRNNLLLGRPDAVDADLWRALDRAAIGDWVRALPEQLETWLGEGGARVSGGQGRRIALARALLSDAPILILDEPCAGLDAETERAFFATLNNAAEGRSVLLIAHRLTGAEKLDRIWRLSGGVAIAAAA